jgi:ABC-type bacteriocin/lantibiotic exporter with double-glycine peptidase domain
MIKVKNFRQQADHDCIPACLHMALDAINVLDMSYDDLKDAAKYSEKHGTYLPDLYNVLDEHLVNYKVRWHGSWTDLRVAVNDGIVFVTFWIPSHKEAHCSIVTEVGLDYIVLNDPWFGKNYRYLKKTFLHRWQAEECWYLVIES